MILVKKFFRICLLVVLLAPAGKALAGPILDVAILMDSSGSLGSSGWAQEKLAVQSYIDLFPVMNVRFGIIRFATGSQTLYDFVDDQDRDTLKSFVANLSYTQGYTYTRDAVDDALGLFENQSWDQNLKAMTIFTDGNPQPSRTQNPCDRALHLANAGIYSNIIAIGNNINSQNLDCLLEDPTEDFVYLDSFGSLMTPTLAGMVAQTQMPPQGVPAPAGALVMLLGLMGLASIRRQ